MVADQKAEGAIPSTRFSRSSAVERRAVNLIVVGANPTGRAKSFGARSTF
ncbi:unnamed protein product [marine sediment metagenome]|uniref:Uncharacterized protein n=1 Tax=marine sediment metagenome TaxID=412755 RepID=X0RRS2_9ZZZZ